MARESLKYFGAALAGSAVGAAVGLLTAPASGQETRRRLGRRLEEEKDALVHNLQDQLQQGKRKLARVVNG